MIAEPLCLQRPRGVRSEWASTIILRALAAVMVMVATTGTADATLTRLMVAIATLLVTAEDQLGPGTETATVIGIVTRPPILGSRLGRRRPRMAGTTDSTIVITVIEAPDGALPWPDLMSTPTSRATGQEPETTGRPGTIDHPGTTAFPEIIAHPETIVDEGTITTTDAVTGIGTVPIESGTTMIEVAPAGQGAGVALPAIAKCIADRTTAIGVAPAGQGAKAALTVIATKMTDRAAVVGNTEIGHHLKQRPNSSIMPISKIPPGQTTSSQRVQLIPKPFGQGTVAAQDNGVH